MTTWSLPCMAERDRTPRGPALLAVLLYLLLGPSLAFAEVLVPPSGVVDLGSGTIDAACTDLIVAGTLNLGTGAFININNVVVQSGGVLNGNSGSISLVGNFTVASGGQYNADSASVRQLNACANIRRMTATPVPTLVSPMLAALSAVLALLATLFLGGSRSGSTPGRHESSAPRAWEAMKR